jgi:hypothetical protein
VSLKEYLEAWWATLDGAGVAALKPDGFNAQRIEGCTGFGCGECHAAAPPAPPPPPPLALSTRLAAAGGAAHAHAARRSTLLHGAVLALALLACVACSRGGNGAAPPAPPRPAFGVEMGGADMAGGTPKPLAGRAPPPPRRGMR